VTTYTISTKLILGTLVAVLFSACTTPTSRCSESASTQGYFCYQGYNFGKRLSGEYKLGVKHGCTTAQGHFVKQYTLSGTSESYKNGWEKGRATCKLIPPEEASSGTMRTQYQQSIDEKKYYGR
jgi:hypothetical protein